MQLMDRNIYELVEMPTLPALTADKLVRIFRPGAAEWTSPWRGARETAGYAAGGGRVRPDDGTLTALLAKGVKLESCVDYNPSSGALPICGLTDPAATVTVNYLTSTGSTDSFYGLHWPGV